jgi:hypothetical protein
VLDPLLERGVLPSLLQPFDRKVPTQSARDVGTVGADLMAKSGPSRRLVEPHGPEDAAAALADLLGKPVTAVAPPEAAWPGIFRAQGFPPVTVEAFCAMYRAFNAGPVAFEGTHEIRRGSTGLREALARLLGARAGGPPRQPLLS